MRAYLLDAGAPETLHPLTLTRPLAACPLANRPLLEQQVRALRAAGFAPVREAPREPSGRALFVRGGAWLGARALEHLRQAQNDLTVTDAEGRILAVLGATPAPKAGTPQLAATDASFLIRYPWDLLRLHELLLETLADAPGADVTSPPASVAEGGRLRVDADTQLLPGVVVEGNVLIGRRCKIGPNCYLRGPTVIGDDCHVGQAVEVKASLIMDRVGLGHLSYVGDSIIGADVNFGAGTITANYRHDASVHRSMVDGELIAPGRRKFGAIVGDGAHTGIHTSIYPGRKLWPGTATRPGAVVQRDIHGQRIDGKAPDPPGPHGLFSRGGDENHT